MSSATSNGDNNEEKSQEVKEANEEKKDDNTEDVKEPVPENEKQDESESDEEDNEVGLLDRPVEVTGSRERKKVQRLELSFNTSSKEKPEIPEGSGQKLGDCPRIEYQIQRNSIDDLKPLHKILFARLGMGKQVKGSIRKFSGFTFQKESSEYKKKKGVLEKIRIANLKHMCEILDVERGGTKEDIVSRILDFLLEPKASAKAVPQPKKSAKRKQSKEKTSEKHKAKKPKKAASPDDSGDNSEDSVAEKASDDETVNKTTKSSKSVNLKKTKGTKKVANKKTSKRKSKKTASSGDSSSDDDDDSGLPRKRAKSPPTNEDIKAFVKKILRTADLEEITMKKVIKQVFDEFPDFDLNARKDFIKETVKSVIS